MEYQVNWTDNSTLNSIHSYQSTSDAMTIYPAMIAIPNTEPEPQKSNNPLDWLREQVNEICNLALAV